MGDAFSDTYQFDYNLPSFSDTQATYFPATQTASSPVNLLQSLSSIVNGTTALLHNYYLDTTLLNTDQANADNAGAIANAGAAAQIGKTLGTYPQVSGSVSASSSSTPMILAAVALLAFVMLEKKR